jgi:hypothetical protein
MKYICIFFSRGCCPYGWECEFLHTLPDPDASLPESSKDCFARDKFADYRDDMGGVGSFNRQNRTLYIGRIKETGNGVETEEVVRRHFKEWGIIERSEPLLLPSRTHSDLTSCFFPSFSLGPPVSPGPAVQERRVRDVRPRSARPVRQRSDGLPIHGQ